MVRYRYTEWDGTQEIPPLDADAVLENLTDDLMNFGDLQHALRNLLQRGMRDPLGQKMQGLRDLLQQLRQQRRQTLDRYNLSSAFDDLKKRLNEILEREKDTIQRRLEDAMNAGAEPPSSSPPSTQGEGEGKPEGQRPIGQSDQSGNSGDDGSDGAEGDQGEQGEGA
ncbi:MAG TPA: VWA domain-containing protein, partial [Dehalococcoidia bacterium]|nr:VWA domain-containing protein [Dehalococcoidia bacterium]